MSRKAGISWIVGMAVLACPAFAARNVNHASPQTTPPISSGAAGFGAGPGSSSVPLPSFDAERVQRVTKELLFKFKSSKPNNWIELQAAAGSVMVNATVPGKLPKFNQERVGNAVEQLAGEIATKNPGSWQELGKILNRFTGVIPASVMENIIAFRIMQRQASDKNQDKLAQNDAVKPEDGATQADAASPKERLNPEAREALDKELDNNIGKFSGFLPPQQPAWSPFTGLMGGSTATKPEGSKDSAGGGNKNDGPRGINVFSSSPATAASAPQPMIPVLSQEPTTFPNFPSESSGNPSVIPSENSSVEKTTTNNNNSSVFKSEVKPLDADKILSALVSQLPPKETQSATPLAPSEFPAMVKAEKLEVEKDKKRQVGTKVGKTGASGAENYGVAGVGSGTDIVATGAQTWLGTAEQWVRAALGLQDPKDMLWNGEEDEFATKKLGTAELGGESFLSLGGLMDGRSKGRSRVVASVAEATGVDIGTAHRLYQGALYSAWGSTIGFLAFALRRLRRKKK